MQFGDTAMESVRAVWVISFEDGRLSMLRSLRAYNVTSLRRLLVDTAWLHNGGSRADG